MVITVHLCIYRGQAAAQLSEAAKTHSTRLYKASETLERLMTATQLSAATTQIELLEESDRMPH